MLLKHVLKVTEVGVQVFGPIHGAIFVAYLVSVLVVRRPLGWGLKTVLVAAAASVPPFATLAFELWADRHGRLTSEPARTPQRARPAPSDRHRPTGPVRPAAADRQRPTGHRPRAVVVNGAVRPPHDTAPPTVQARFGLTPGVWETRGPRRGVSPRGFLVITDHRVCAVGPGGPVRHLGRERPPATCPCAGTGRPVPSHERSHLAVDPHHRGHHGDPAVRRLHHRAQAARAVQQGDGVRPRGLRRAGGPVRPRGLVLRRRRATPPSTTPAG